MVRTEDIEAEFEVQLMRISDPSIRNWDGVGPCQVFDMA